MSRSRDDGGGGVRRRSRLSTKVVFFSTALVVVAVSASFLLFGVQIRRQTGRLLSETVAQQQAVLREVERRRVEQLLLTSALLTDSPTLRAAMDVYRTEARSGAPLREDLLTTIRNEAEKVAAMIGRDLFVITDDRGRVLAASGSAARVAPVGGDLSTQPVLRHALDQDGPIDDRNLAVLDLDGQPFRAGTVPVILQGFVIGALVLGDRIDSGFIEDLSRSLRCKIVVRRDDEILGSSLLETAGAEALLAALDDTSGGAEGISSEVRYGRARYVTASLPLGSDARGRQVTLYMLHSLTAALAGANRTLAVTGLAVGLGAALLAALAGWWTSRSILLPLTRFVRRIHAVAETGDYSGGIDEQTSHEMGVLTETYNRLTESLREHERRLCERSREDLERMERLKESEKLAALGRMLSGAAHEINNPLTGVVGNIDMLLAEERLDGRSRERLEVIRREGRRIVGLVRSLLKTAHRETPEHCLLDLNQVVREAAALRRRDFTSAGIDLQLDLARDPVTVLGNELELQQVMLNLLQNAVDALAESERGGSLVASTRLEGDTAVLTVADDGPGFRDPKRIFEHFYTTKPVGQGTGLGLSISHSIVERHGGNIAAENRPEGGALFSIELPRAAEDVVAPPRPAAAETTAQTPRRSIAASVLVVDDEPSVLELQVAILDSLGATVTGAESGAAALTLLAQRDFDLVVSDLHMPGEVSGERLHAWVREHRPDTAFVFVTGDTVDEKEFLERLDTRYLLKPFDMDEYVATVQESLDAGQAA